MESKKPSVLDKQDPRDIRERRDFQLFRIFQVGSLLMGAVLIKAGLANQSIEPSGGLDLRPLAADLSVATGALTIFLGLLSIWWTNARLFRSATASAAVAAMSVAFLPGLAAVFAPSGAATSAGIAVALLLAITWLWVCNRMLDLANEEEIDLDGTEAASQR